MTGEVAIRVRDLLRDIAMEHDHLGQGRARPCSRVCGASADAVGEPDHAVAEGDQLAGAVAGIPPLSGVRDDRREKLQSSPFPMTGITTTN